MLRPWWRLFDTWTGKYIRYSNGNCRSWPLYSEACSIWATEFGARKAIIVTQDYTLEKTVDDKQEALKQIETMIEAAKQNIRNAAEVARKAGVDFTLDLSEFGLYEEVGFKGAPEGWTTGWNSSYC